MKKRPHNTSYCTSVNKDRLTNYDCVVLCSLIESGVAVSATDIAFVVGMGLKSPIIPGRRLMLDALLSGLLFERTGDPTRAIEEIPLVRVGQTWCGSQVLLEGPCAAIPMVYTMALRAERDLSPKSVRPGGRGGKFQRIESGRGPYQNKLTEMLAYEARAVWFCGRGSLDAIQGLLEDVPAIGKKRSSGFGAISRESIDIEEIDGEWPGLMLSDGTPARAVPVEVWKEIGGSEDVEFAYEAARPPYWQGEHETCAVPSHLVVDREQAGKLIGLN
jgi:hypothetical protein